METKRHEPVGVPCKQFDELLKSRPEWMIEYMRETPKWVLVQPNQFAAGETTAENVLRGLLCVQTRRSGVGVVEKPRCSGG